jgi:hypothetical protein
LRNLKVPPPTKIHNDGKGKKRDLIIEWPCRHHLNQVARASITRGSPYPPHGPPATKHQEGHDISFCDALIKNTQPKLTAAKPTLRTLYKTTAWYFSEVRRSRKGKLRSYPRLEESKRV